MTTGKQVRGIEAFGNVTRWLSFVRLPVAALVAAFAGVSLAEDSVPRHVHDPVIIREKGIYYVFSSGRGVPVWRSADLVRWERDGRVFREDLPPWGKAEVPGAKDVWAPDISQYAGRFHLYYAISTVGSQRSCIGHATARTLDRASPEYGWTDHGKVLETFPGKVDYNAIDANFARDAQGRSWLVLGSFWSGIKMVRLDPETGGRVVDDGTVYGLAARPPNGPIEGAFLVRRGDFHYLFVSFDLCCRGVASNYKVMVGRSREITGPYVDFKGRRMLEGGGTLVLAGYGSWRGPGHNGILMNDDGRDWMVHHMYDATANGVATLQVRPLLWSEDGWPMVGEPVAAVPKTASRPAAGDLGGMWRHGVNFGAEEYLELLPAGRLNSAVDGARWSLSGPWLWLSWPNSDAPGGTWIDACLVAPDGRSYVGRNQRGDVVRGQR